MRVRTIAEQFQEALALRDMRDSANGVKRVAIQALQSLDPSAVAADTGYFNHSIAPDLVLTWPSGRTERHVHLKLSSNPAYISDDLRYLGARDALLLSAVDFRDDQSAVSQLDSTARESASILLDPSGVEVLSEESASDSLTAVLPPSLVRGGQGVQTGPLAAQLVETVRQGFEGASASRSGAVAAARDAIGRQFTDQTSEELQFFLLALWLASDGRSDQFPGPLPLGGSLSVDVLSRLLNMPDVRDPVFWRAVSDLIDLPLLASASPEPGDSDNVQALMAQAASTMKARRLRVFQASLDDQVEGFQWRVANGLVELLGPSFVACVDVTKDARRVTKRQMFEPPTVRQFATRAQFADVRDVTYAGAEERVTVAGQGIDATRTTTFIHELEEFPDRRVLASTVDIEGLECVVNLQASEAALVGPRATTSVALLTVHTIPLMAPLEEGEVELLRDLFPQIEGNAVTEDEQIAIELEGDDPQASTE